MNKNKYTALHSHNGLLEAIEVLLHVSDDEKYDLAIIPCHPCGLTENEEGADKDMMAYFIPQDLPGTTKVFRSREDSGSEDTMYIQRQR